VLAIDLPEGIKIGNEFAPSRLRQCDRPWQRMQLR
jgi:hypothetical protein